MKVPRDLVLLWAATAVAGGRGPFALPFVSAVPTTAAEAVAEELDWTHTRVVGFKDALLSLLAPAGSASDADMSVGDYDVAADVPNHHHHAAGVREILLEQRQSDGEDDDDKKELYLCSNPDFDTTCGEGCMCASVPVTTSPISYGGKPPCAALPYSLRPGNPQGVSSAKAYSGWNCTLFAGQYCEEDTPPADTLQIQPGPPGLDSLGDFDDLAQSYRCVVA
ncbi:hypothetical protein MN608_06525 [Microdochium nivale]|nr:hypothetical protein MN608_06525 [Microdochium nivale]